MKIRGAVDFEVSIERAENRGWRVDILRWVPEKSGYDVESSIWLEGEEPSYDQVVTRIGELVADYITAGV